MEKKRTNPISSETSPAGLGGSATKQTNTHDSCICEPKMLFRADTDQHGDWYVWRQLSKNGWATMRRCDTREDAQKIADALNLDPTQEVFHC